MTTATPTQPDVNAIEDARRNLTLISASAYGAANDAPGELLELLLAIGGAADKALLALDNL